MENQSLAPHHGVIPFSQQAFCYDSPNGIFGISLETVSMVTLQSHTAA